MSTRSARPSRAIILRLAGTLISLALLVYLLTQQGWQEIGMAIRQIPAWRFVVALALTMVSRFAVAGRWYVLLRSAGMPISYGKTTRLTFAGLFSSNFLPTTIGGDVVRMAGAIQLKYDAAIAAASLVADRLIGMAGMATTLPFGLPSLMQAQIIPSAARLPAFSLLASNKLPAPLRSLVEKASAMLQDVLQALTRWLRQPRTLLVALGFTWLHMACLFGSIWLLLAGMGEQVNFWLVAGLWSAVYFITLIPISINGYGLQEISMAVIFSSAGGVSTQASLTIAILVRTLTLLGSLPGALYVPGIMSAREQPEPS